MQDQKFLFSVQATSCKFSNIHHLNKRFPLTHTEKFCLSQNGIAREYGISLEKENYNDIGTALDFLQEKDIRVTTLQQRQCQAGKPTSKTQRCNNVSF